MSQQIAEIQRSYPKIRHCYSFMKFEFVYKAFGEALLKKGRSAGIEPAPKAPQASMLTVTLRSPYHLEIIKLLIKLSKSLFFFL